jgi:hypothetical protein
MYKRCILASFGIKSLGIDSLADGEMPSTCVTAHNPGRLCYNVGSLAETRLDRRVEVDDGNCNVTILSKLQNETKCNTIVDTTEEWEVDMVTSVYDGRSWCLSATPQADAAERAAETARLYRN